MSLKIFEGWIDLWSDLASFGAERAHQNVLEMHELLHARHPNMVLSIRLRYLQKTVDMYRDEAARLVRLQKNLGP